MAEEEPIDVQYSFLVVRKINGDVGVQAEPDSELTIHEIYESLCTLKANLEAQQVANFVAQGMQQVAQAMQGKTDKGIVLPR